MDVVGHEAPGPDGDLGGAAVLAQEVAVEAIVGVAEEGALAAVAALRDVMRHSRRDRSRHPCHAGIHTRAAEGLKESRVPESKIRWGHGEDHPPHLYAPKKSLKFYETQDQLPDKIETILASSEHFTVDDRVSLFYKQFRVHGFLL
jgi:hypothetical protein